MSEVQIDPKRYVGLKITVTGGVPVTQAVFSATPDMRQPSRWARFKAWLRRLSGKD
jgi:hypothetical protein